MSPFALPIPDPVPVGTPKMVISPTRARISAKKTTNKRNKCKRSQLQKRNSPKTPIKIEMNETNAREIIDKLDTEEIIDDLFFEDHKELSEKMAQSFYFANKLPTTSRPSFPLTVLAVNAFTSGTFGVQFDSLEFLDLEMASQVGINACVSPTVLIMAIVYLERLSNHNPGYLRSIKPSELFVVSLLVASKFIQDDGEDSDIFNDEWASSANMNLKDINKLEIGFLTAIDWNVNVTKEEFQVAFDNVERKLALEEATSRGWFTYGEIDTLSKLLLPVFNDYILKVVSAACVTYTAFIATVFSSAILAPYIFMATKSLLTTQMHMDTNELSGNCSRLLCARPQQNDSLPGLGLFISGRLKDWGSGNLFSLNKKNVEEDLLYFEEMFQGQLDSMYRNKGKLSEAPPFTTGLIREHETSEFLDNTFDSLKKKASLTVFKTEHNFIEMRKNSGKVQSLIAAY